MQLYQAPPRLTDKVVHDTFSLLSYNNTCAITTNTFVIIVVVVVVVKFHSFTYHSCLVAIQTYDYRPYNELTELI